MLGSCLWFIVSRFAPWQRYPKAPVSHQVGVAHQIVIQQVRVVYAIAMCPISRACGVVVSHPLRMRKALGSIPSRSNCQNQIQPSSFLRHVALRSPLAFTPCIALASQGALCLRENHAANRTACSYGVAVNGMPSKVRMGLPMPQRSHSSVG